MIFRIIAYCCLLVFPVLAQAQKRLAVPIIFDTDMGPDYDDAGAITLLHALADSGQAKILATIASTRYEGVAGVLNVFNTYFHRAGIPIGLPKAHGLELRDFQHWTDTLLAKYPHSVKSNALVPEAVEVYRKTLATQPAGSVTIVTVGFLTNVAALFNSTGDQYSPLSGKELIRQKVKLLVCMAGRFPSGKEFNVERDASASKVVFDNWNTPVVISGFEIGQKIKTGLPLVQNTAIHNNPTKDVFSICLPKAAEDAEGRMSWDETAVLVAIKGHKPWYRLLEGKMDVNANGSNTWNEKGKGQFRLVEDAPFQEVQAVINKLMMHQPRRMVNGE